MEVDAERVRVRMADFKVDVPRGSVQRVGLSSHRTRGTVGVHAKSGRWLVNGSANGLIEIVVEPPCHTERCLSSLFLRREVSALIVSLVDPEGFVDAMGG
ncbi:MAG TPA: hypothetical protein VGX23_20920 [Actinocrinis sp.]|nr:hypothetical protein [Actinocrinis sp.]